MAGKVIHLRSDVHDRAKEYCKSRNIRMKEWVEMLIEKALLPSNAVPVKPLPQLQNSKNEVDTWTQPPFWNKDQDGDNT